jgi:hypothetical protein
MRTSWAGYKVLPPSRSWVAVDEGGEADFQGDEVKLFASESPALDLVQDMLLE